MFMKKQNQAASSCPQQTHKTRRNMKINNLKLSLKQHSIFKQDDQSSLQEDNFVLGKAQSCIQLENAPSQQRETGKTSPTQIKTGGIISKPAQQTGSFEDKYTIGQKIGEGAHGVVRKCFLKESNDVFAVKTIKMDIQHVMFLKENFTEIKKLNHKNVIGYKALFLEPSSSVCHLVMEYLPYPDLLHIKIKNQRQLQEITYQILSTLAYIHSQNICHRDIKPENILYDEKSRNIKIIDFGISKKLTKRNIKKDMLTQTGTLYYRAPEMFEGGGYDERVDLWALGATIFKLMTGNTPFESVYLNETITNIMKGEFSFPQKMEKLYSKSSRNLVARLLKKKEERLTAQEALLDVWFIELFQNSDDFTKSLIAKSKGLRIFGHTFIHHKQDLYHSNTVQGQGIENKINQKRTQQLILELKSKHSWIEQPNMIFNGVNPTKNIRLHLHS